MILRTREIAQGSEVSFKDLSFFPGTFLAPPHISNCGCGDPQRSNTLKDPSIDLSNQLVKCNQNPQPIPPAVFWDHTWQCPGVTPVSACRNHSWPILEAIWDARNPTHVRQMPFLLSYGSPCTFWEPPTPKRDKLSGLGDKPFKQLWRQDQS